ncbi:MAG: AraC family transcriptional regulator [Rudaea sp.]
MQTIEISRQHISRTSRHGVLQNPAVERKHARTRRRVRLNYPDEVVQCAVLLSCLVGVRKAALALDLRLSTMYRWFNDHRARRSQFVLRMVEGDGEHEPDFPGDMIVRCDEKNLAAHPFVLRQLRGRPRQHTLAAADFPFDMATAAQAMTTPDSVVPSERILSAKALIDRQYWTDWSCEKLAGLIGISRFQFINEFSAAFGQSPYHYLLGVRVHHATELVSRRSDQTLAEIARSVGFGSTSSMRRAFKNFLGASPAHFLNERTASPSDLEPTNSDANQANHEGREVQLST